MTRTLGTNAAAGTRASGDGTWRPPLITVGIPVFNGERWIGEAIEAILAQSFGDFELLISDNCSTDRSYEICRTYAAQDSRIRLMRNPRNVGVTENFNILCRMAAGQYFKYTSCNDLCAPDYLRRCVEVLEARPDVVLCHPMARLIQEDCNEFKNYETTLHLVSHDPVERMIAYLEADGLNNAIQGLIRVDALRQTPLLGQYLSSDINMMAELSLYGKFYQVPEYLFYRRVGRESLSTLRSPKELAVLLNPSKSKLVWQSWKYMLALSGIVFRAPLTFKDRLRLIKYIGRRWRLARHLLLADITGAIKAIFRRSA